MSKSVSQTTKKSAKSKAAKTKHYRKDPVSSRWNFKSIEALVEHLARALDIEPASSQSLTGTGRSVPKDLALRLGRKSGRAINDPVLALITSPHGELVVGDQSFNMARGFAGAARPGARAPGGRTDLPGVIAHEVACYDDISGLERCEDENGKSVTFGDDTGWIRFRAYRKSNWLYWSMGAEIDTFGPDFEAAIINSRYYQEFLSPVCVVQKYDSDSDTNDDFLDEWEWGVNAPQPIRVESLCRAQWRGKRLSAVVSAGDPCYAEGVNPWPDGWPTTWPPADPAPDPVGRMDARPRSLSFLARIGQMSVTKSFQITNTHDQPKSVTIDAPVIDPPQPQGRTTTLGGITQGDFTAVSGQITVPANSVINIPVTFTSVSGLGPVTGRIRVVLDGGSATISLSGRALEVVSL